MRKYTIIKKYYDVHGKRYFKLIDGQIIRADKKSLILEQVIENEFIDSL